MRRQINTNHNISYEQIVVPGCLHNKLLWLAHDIPAAGHLAERKTKFRLMNHFWWHTRGNSLEFHIRCSKVPTGASCSSVHGYSETTSVLKNRNGSARVPKECVKFMAATAITMDRRQGESQCYQGLFMPAIQHVHKKILSCSSTLSHCSLLAQALVKAVEVRFSHLFSYAEESEVFAGTAACHP